MTTEQLDATLAAADRVRYEPPPHFTAAQSQAWRQAQHFVGFDPHRDSYLAVEGGLSVWVGGERYHFGWGASPPQPTGAEA